MSPPTSLLSSRELAQRCSDKFTHVTGTHLPGEIQSNLERLAAYFLRINRFREFLTFIPWDSFLDNPNAGHVAIADFLCCQALSWAATTNFDTHIEDAAKQLGERDFLSALDGVEAEELTDRHRPLLKLHGCCRRDRKNTLWTNLQIRNNEEIRNRISKSKNWLRGYLTGKDILVVGFWTDWAYLNDVFSDAMEGSEPRTVVLVDPENEQVLQAKAPRLWNWAKRSGKEFFHVAETAETFLDELRVVFSRRFIEKVLSRGVECFREIFPELAVVENGGLDSLGSDDLYSLRKDLCCCSSAQPSRMRNPDETMDLVGAFILALLAKGGSIEGNCFHLKGRGIRVINCANRLLAKVKERFATDLGASRGCNVVFCLGASDAGVPSNIVRGEEPRTIVRQGWDGEWMDTDTAREWLRR